MERIRHGTGTTWEPKVGYSRAVRVGPFVHVSGPATTLVEVRRLIAPGLLVEIEADAVIPDPD